MSGPELQLSYAARTHPGKARERNEDALLARSPVFLVADGMGGHAGGELASAAAVAAFEPLLQQQWVSHSQLSDTVELAARSVAGIAEGEPAPGTTVAGVVLSLHGGTPCWLVFNVGDSRVYLGRAGEVRQLTVDHTAERAGIPGPPNAITRALGAGVAEPVADQRLIPAMVGDRLLVCSDGLSRELPESVLAGTLVGVADVEAAAQELMDLALTAGGRDNVTLIVVDCLQTRAQVADASLEDVDLEEAEATVMWTMPDPAPDEGGR